ncbi:mitofusin, partial [Spiromyces aspiralis]
MWSYAETVIRAMAQHLEHEVGECERFAGFTINQAMAELKRIQGEQQHHIDRYKAIEKTTTAGAGGGDDIAISGSGEDLSTSYLAHIGSISNALDTFSLQPTDFVDFDWEKWMAMTSMSVSAGTLALLATRFNSLADSVLSLIRLSSTISSGTTHRVMLAAATLLGIGSAFYLVSDMDATVRNNVARRLRDALHEEGFAVNHADRLSTETSRSLRPFVWKLQHMFQRMVEAEERRRADQLNRRHMAQDAQMHFDEIRSKARELAELVAGLSGGGATDSSGTI